MDYWWLIPIAYGAGSAQWGLVVVRLLRGVDVRDYGSGKTGVTNVLRAAGWPAAAGVLIADAGKGVLPVVAARLLSDDPWLHASVAFGVIVGHILPLFSGFRGGRGIATGVGTASALDPWMALVGLGVFLPVVGISRYVSLGSVLSVAAVVIAFAVTIATGVHPTPYLWYAIGGGVTIIWMHRENIQRIVQGTERKLGQRVM